MRFEDSQRFYMCLMVVDGSGVVVSGTGRGLLGVGISDCEGSCADTFQLVLGSEVSQVPPEMMRFR